MGKRITILEDDFDIREICTYLLSGEGYEVQGFENVASLMAGMEKTDLFLLDVRLPDGNGLEVCKQLKNNPSYHKTPIIMMSAHMETFLMREQCPAEGFIEKPFSLDLLLRQVGNLTR